MKKIGIGVVGCGFFGSSLAEQAAENPAMTLAAVSDLDGAAARATGARLSAAGLDSVDELVARDDVDVVLVATPNHTHTAPVLAAIAAGKAVFVEKPIAIEPTDARAMVDAAAGAGVPLMVGHVMRTMPGVRRLVERVRAGHIGQLRTVESCRTRWVDSGDADSSWWKLDRARTGGELTHEIHELDLLCWIGGEVEDAVSESDPLDGHRHTLVRFASGAIGHHSIAAAAHIARWDLAVEGETGAIVADFRTGRVRRIVQGDVVEEWTVFADEDANRSLVESATQVQRYNAAGGAMAPWMQAAIRHELDEVVRVAGGEVDSVLLEAPARALEVAAALRTGDKLRSKEGTLR